MTSLEIILTAVIFHMAGILAFMVLDAGKLNRLEIFAYATWPVFIIVAPIIKARRRRKNTCKICSAQFQSLEVHNRRTHGGYVEETKVDK